MLLWSACVLHSEYHIAVPALHCLLHVNAPLIHVHAPTGTCIESCSHLFSDDGCFNRIDESGWISVDNLLNVAQGPSSHLEKLGK